eukprot:scaffold168638_cov27-Tisochrysis_lutea.AAC.5
MELAARVESELEQERDAALEDTRTQVHLPSCASVWNCQQQSGPFANCTTMPPHNLAYSDSCHSVNLVAGLVTRSLLRARQMMRGFAARSVKQLLVLSSRRASRCGLPIIDTAASKGVQNFIITMPTRMHFA